LREWVRF